MTAFMLIGQVKSESGLSFCENAVIKTAKGSLSW